MERFRELENVANISNGHTCFGIAAYGQGAMERARSECATAAALAKATESSTFTSTALECLGLVATELGHDHEAAVALEDAFSEGQKALDQAGTPRRLAITAILAIKQGTPELATRLLGAAEAQCLVLGRPYQQPERAVFERAADRTRSLLGEERYTAALADGASLSPEVAIAEARTFLRSEISDPTTLPIDPTGAVGLTRREEEILRLVADGHTDREIAAALFISPATVRTHLANVYAKLDVRSRTSAIAAARRAGIL